jgi:hypothetical protein
MSVCVGRRRRCTVHAFRVVAMLVTILLIGCVTDGDGPPLPCDQIDEDGDGISACEDCDDLDPDRAPGLPELCDGIDNDCDGSLGEVDEDGDGFQICAGDCDDTRPDVHPGASESCDGVDTDCNGATLATESDRDGDGVPPCGGDCDDDDPALHPGAEDPCDGVDTDCDGLDDCELSTEQWDGLAWVQSLARVSCEGAANLAEEVVQLAAGAEEGGCPEPEVVLDQGPVWFGECPWECETSDCDCTGWSEWRRMTGGCIEPGGAVLDGTIEQEAASVSLTGLGPFIREESGLSVLASGFTRVSPTPPEEPRLVSADGTVDSWTTYYTIQPVAEDVSEGDCAWSVQGTFERHGSALGGGLLDGVSTVALGGSRLDRWTTLWGGEPTDTWLIDRLIEGTTETTLGALTLTADIDLDWYGYWWGGAPRPQEGCFDEPGSGSVRLRAFADGDAEPLWELVVRFDGHVDGECDGCGSVYFRDAPVARSCVGWGG